MRERSWKDIAELIGISAIVVSLVFVGMQMRQSQRLAWADSVLAMRANVIEEGALQAEHIDVWLRGNAGEELNARDYEIYKILFLNRQSGEFYNWISLEQLDTQNEAVGPTMLARYLHRNPGARAEWKLQRSQADASKVGGRGRFPAFAVEVESVLMNLDERDSGN